MGSQGINLQVKHIDDSLRGITTRDKTNVDLQKERDGASFDPMQLTYVLDQGQEKTYHRRYIEHLALSDPELAKFPNYYYLSRPERYEEVLRKYVHCWKRCKELNIQDQMDVLLYTNTVAPNEMGTLSMHMVAFVPMFKIQASDEQKDKWLKKMENLEIIGSYSQTELSHGTFVRGLETRADYDPQTQEFVLNTPNLSSMKWWVGGLGKTSNHTLLIAQLYTQGKQRGLHAFLVPIRDMNTHEPLPGVTVGDIGPKIGFDEMDNGFLRLNNVRIPRGNMLNAHSQVDPDGSYTPALNDKIMYAGMLGIRASLPQASARSLGQACTVAIRYSCVRRQSELQPGGPEPQVLDFQTQQHKLFPLLAKTYSFWFVAGAMTRMHKEGMEEIMEGDFSKLLELHSLSSGLKAYCTLQVIKGVEICRLACGGHGYSQASGLPKMYVAAAAPATAEGEATVLMLQNARYLMKCHASAMDGERMDTYSSYLLQKNFEHPNFSNNVTLSSLLDAVAYRAKQVVSYAASQLAKAQKASQHAWNDTSVLLVKATEAHVEYVLAKCFVDHLKELKCNGAVKDALNKMCSLFMTDLLLENAGDLLKDGYLNESQLDALRSHQLSLYAVVRPDGVAYVDGFDFTDRNLASSLGRYDGNVYEDLYDFARNYPMNKTEVHESYHKYLKNITTAKL